MGLLPLEFTDSLMDSPYFRQNLHAHERELSHTSIAIKSLIKDVKELFAATKALSKAHRTVSNTLIKFRLDCIGVSQTDDEVVISNSLKQFGELIARIEDERERMEGKKKFEKQSQKFYQSQERYLSLSSKKHESFLQEADASVEFEQRDFHQASLEYVYLLQEVQERKKFEIVETGYDFFSDFKPYMTAIQVRVQRTRENFNATRSQAEQLKQRMLEVRKTPLDPGSLNRMYTRQGYLYLQEKRAFGTTGWTKHYCQYDKASRTLVMIPYSQLANKITTTESLVVHGCQPADYAERRFCFDVTTDDRLLTLQAVSMEDRKLWLDAMAGREIARAPAFRNAHSEETHLDEVGMNFIRQCIQELERRGLDEQGLYRVVGVGSKVNKLLAYGLNPSNCDLALDNPLEWETKTLTSAVKQFFRSLPEPLMTFHLHGQFIASVKQADKMHRILRVHQLVYRLPTVNREVLHLLLAHLGKVARLAERNLMSINNLGVCFGPTLMRPEEETVASIMEIKFCNAVIEILIEHCDQAIVTSYNVSPSKVVLERHGEPGDLPPHAFVANDDENSSQNSHPSPLSSRFHPDHSYAPSYRSQKVRTLYSCTAETNSELSFDPNQIITNENYVEYLP